MTGEKRLPQLDARLSAAAGYVRPGHVAADIGCDHGKLTGTSENEMPQCLNHIPLIIHAPGLVAEEVQSWCMQMDVQPTLLSMLGITAHQENFGQNVLQHPRSMALYTADNVIGARTDGHLYVYEPATHTEWL